MSSQQTSGKWLARWRETPGGPQKMRSFTRKIDADRFDTEIHHQLHHWASTSTRLPAIWFQQYADEWLKPTPMAASHAGPHRRELRPQ